MPPSTARNCSSGVLGMTLSEGEHSSRRNLSAAASSTRVLFELKESLAAIMLTFTGQGKGPKEKISTYNAFRLARDDNSDLLIFVNALRHDKDSGEL
ncbi:hypothetical protein LTR33_014947 [Friedmanniomyces endolithicus]|nr:hypothetical protein LTR33_014947 [Friedmanniomyces endolithicus]